MSNTSTIELPKQGVLLPEWRRLCHFYNTDSLRSVCGTAIRPAVSEGHSEKDCEARGHTVCVVCCDLHDARFSGG
jgi:hypothetical protein